MRKFTLIILGCLVLSSCVKRGENSNQNSFSILIALKGEEARNGKDYIKLWVDDTLKFSGSYHIRYSEGDLDDIWGMEIASINKGNKSKIKIKLKLISLDSVLFLGKRIVDTTFNYDIHNIPCISIADIRYRGYFNVFDTINSPEHWKIE